MNVKASLGDLVTCDQGHPIAYVGDDIVGGALVRASQFIWLRPDHRPKPHDAITGCPDCGRPYIRVNHRTLGAQLHTRERGWKSK